WTTGGNLLGRLPLERRWMNFKNFVGELKPDEPFLPWAWELLMDGGGIALLTTLGISSMAIILASAAVILFLPLASRNLASNRPFGIRSANDGGAKWRFVGVATRLLFVLSRAVPEYIIAFLLISLLGLTAWPLIIALAIHNFGILGRLWSEVTENADPAAAVHQLASGSGRFKVFGVVLLPALFNRFLIYFFYRWETCTKDATVLGMLGLLTLGHLVALSKGFFWDEMFFYIMLGASVILVGDLLSTWVRHRLREN
ncbi:MAG: ABC transporter permease subunit, partial [Verrucomicrobiota bacterium]